MIDCKRIQQLKIMKEEVKKLNLTPAKIWSEPGARFITIAWPSQCATEPVAEAHRQFLRTFEQDILEIDRSLNRDDDEFRNAIVVIAGGIITGPFLDRIVELTGYTRVMVNDISDNMRASGLWGDSKMDLEWINDLGLKPAALWCHVLVAQGKATAQWNDKRCKWEYQAVPTT